MNSVVETYVLPRLSVSFGSFLHRQDATLIEFWIYLQPSVWSGDDQVVCFCANCSVQVCLRIGERVPSFRYA